MIYSIADLLSLTLSTGAYSSDIDQEVTCDRPGDPITVRTTMTFDFSTHHPPTHSRFLPPRGMELSEALTFLLAGRVPREVDRRSTPSPAPTPSPTRSSSPVEDDCASSASSGPVDLNDEGICDACLLKHIIAPVSDCDCEEGVALTGMLILLFYIPFH